MEVHGTMLTSEVYLYNILAGKLEFLHLDLTEDPTQIGYKHIGIYCIASRMTPRKTEVWGG